jgi:hypothetical protein
MIINARRPNQNAWWPGMPSGLSQGMVTSAKLLALVHLGKYLTLPIIP